MIHLLKWILLKIINLVMPSVVSYIINYYNILCGFQYITKHLLLYYYIMNYYIHNYQNRFLVLLHRRPFR